MKLLLMLWMALAQCITGFGALFAPSAAPPEVIAHRGANRYAPENTLPAFRKAIALGADSVETDVIETADGVIVLSHDETIDRCSNGTGRVADMTYAQLLQYDFGVWFSSSFAGTKIPTLTEFLNTVQGMGSINIELKGPVTPAKVVGEVRHAGLLDKVVFSSFRMDYLDAARTAEPGAKLALIYGAGSETAKEIAKDPAGFCRAHHLSALHGGMGSFTGDMVWQCHKNGIAVRLWTVNDKENVSVCIWQGVDGIITDDAELVQAQAKRWMIAHRWAVFKREFGALVFNTFMDRTSMLG
jgi:glycerophosphoryl diester phosphodiesterase